MAREVGRLAAAVGGEARPLPAQRERLARCAYATITVRAQPRDELRLGRIGVEEAQSAQRPGGRDLHREFAAIAAVGWRNRAAFEILANLAGGGVGLALGRAQR